MKCSKIFNYMRRKFNITLRCNSIKHECLGLCQTITQFSSIWKKFVWLQILLIYLLYLSAFAAIIVIFKAYISFDRENIQPPINKSAIKDIIWNTNQEEKIYNEDIFGSEKNYSLVIAVQMHTRLKNLKYLIHSLRLAKGISDVLLIFSHSYFDSKINKLVQSIKFCRVMQIFYPYSLQLYPNEFPGSDPDDCPFYIRRRVKGACKNVDYPDKRGLYRAPGHIQVKHHWWWKAYKIFYLKELEKYDDLVLFLEDDYYLVEDFIPLLKVMKHTATNYCPRCKILSLAESHMAVHVEKAMFNESDIVKQTVQFNNMGLSFNRSTWYEILAYENKFCKMDEIDWDSALQYIFTNIMQGEALAPRGPRVLHTGRCGIHAYADHCDPSELVARIQEQVASARPWLYPKKLYVVNCTTDREYRNGHGGWGDPRDHAFCLGMGTNYL